jgi:hypothetical protein
MAKKIIDQIEYLFLLGFYYKNKISNSPQIGTKLMHGNPTLLLKISFNRTFATNHYDF